MSLAFAPLTEGGRTGVRSGVRVHVQEAALSRVLANLLDDAVHASPRGSVRVLVYDTGRDFVSLVVGNEPGRVQAAAQKSLFERAAGNGLAITGRGLGLAIARAAVEAHSRSIRFVELGPPRASVRVELPR